MNLGIVIPLKSKSASRNWDATTAMLYRTLLSVRQQSSDAFAAVVVGHDKPEFMSEFKDCVRFVRVATSPPTLTNDKAFEIDNQERFTLDKNSKILEGMQALYASDISHWFTLDADDLLHANFVETIAADGCKNGGVIECGYMFYSSSGRYIKTNEFSQYCGSSSILASKHMSVATYATDSRTVDCPWFRYPHSQIHKYFQKELNTDFTSFSLPLVAYVLAHGDNCSDGYRRTLLSRLRSKLKPWVLGRPIPLNLAENFAIADQRKATNR